MSNVGRESFFSSQGFWDLVFGVLFVGITILLYSLIQKTAGGVPTRIPLFDFVLIVLALYRLTHLVVYDKITRPIREYFSRFERGLGKTIYELLICPWCTGIWLALFLVFFYLISPIAWFFILILAISSLSAVVKILLHRFSH